MYPRFYRWLVRRLPSERQRLLAVTILAGALCGLAAVAFHSSIMGLESLLIDRANHATGHSWIWLTILSPTIGGLIAGIGLTYFAPAAAGSGIPQVKVAYSLRDGMVTVRETIGKFVLCALQIGSGASLGREVAPRQFALALSNVATGWIKRLTERDREILLACAAGAGLGAVYAVPLGGALFTLRIMLKSWHPRAVGAALITSSLAVSISSFITHDEPNLHWPNPDVSYLLIGYAAVLAPLALSVGLVFNRLMGWASRRELPKSWLLIPGIAGAGLLVGVCSHWWPELPGNGRSILNVILAGGMNLETAAIVLVLKLVVTAAFLRVGARGGLFTPALACGAAAGTLFVLGINAVAGTHYGVPATALAGSAGVLAITQNAPLWAAIFVWELARPPLWLSLVFMTTALSTYGLRKLLQR